jgi:HEAT repeat protein
MAILRRAVRFPHAEIRTEALRALDMCAHCESGENTMVETGELRNLLSEEAAIAAWALATQQALAAGDGVPRHLVDALGAEVDLARERMLLLAQLIYDRATVTRAQAGLACDAPEQRANAVELLDNVLAHADKSLLLPLVEEIAPAERLRRLVGRLGGRLSLPDQGRLTSRDELVIDVLARPPHWLTPWTKACALHTMGLLGTMTALEPVVSGLSAPDPIVRETAIWALGELRPAGLAHTLGTFTNDAAGNVATIAQEVLTRCS